MAFLNAVHWVKHVRGTQQINDSHPHVLAYEIDSHELENASHFAMRISLFSSLVSILSGMNLTSVLLTRRPSSRAPPKSLR